MFFGEIVDAGRPRYVHDVGRMLQRKGMELDDVGDVGGGGDDGGDDDNNDDHIHTRGVTHSLFVPLRAQLVSRPRDRKTTPGVLFRSSLPLLV